MKKGILWILIFTLCLGFAGPKGFDANYILEEFMGTSSKNESTKKLISLIYENIEHKDYDMAEQKIEQLVNMTNENHEDVIMARMLIKRRRSL